MARPKTCRKPTFACNYEFVEGALTRSNNTLTLISTIFKAVTLAFTLTPIPDLLGIYTNINLQKAIKLALESFV